MPLTPADSTLLGRLFSHPEVAALLTDEAYVRRLLAVEGALATVQGGLGVIPPESASAIAALTQSFTPDLDAMREGLLADGVPVWRAVGAALADRSVVARLHTATAPFGVGYLVADWMAR